MSEREVVDRYHENKSLAAFHRNERTYGKAWKTHVDEEGLVLWKIEFSNEPGGLSTTCAWKVLSLGAERYSIAGTSAFFNSTLSDSGV